MQPQRLLELIVANNPAAIKRNLYNAGIANLDVIVSANNVMNAFVAWQRTQNRTDAEAVVFIANVLNVPIETATISGGLIQNEMEKSGKSLYELIISIFSQALGIKVEVSAENQNNAFSENHKILQYVVLGFAIVGVIAVGYWLGKLLKKIID